MSSFKSFRTRSAHSARENEVLTSGRSIVASAGISGSTFGSRIRTILGRCTRLKVSTISGMPFSAGFTTIKSMCESHMMASETACRQFKAGTMFHPALANNSPTQKINPKSSSTIKLWAYEGRGSHDLSVDHACGISRPAVWKVCPVTSTAMVLFTTRTMFPCISNFKGIDPSRRKGQLINSRIRHRFGSGSLISRSTPRLEMFMVRPNPISRTPFPPGTSYSTSNVIG